MISKYQKLKNKLIYMIKKIKMFFIKYIIIFIAIIIQKCFLIAPKYYIIKHKIKLRILDLKAFLLKLQYIFSLKSFLKNVIIIFIVASLACLTFSKSTEYNSSLLYTILGFVFSLWATHIYETIQRLYRKVKYINLTASCISSVYGMANSVFQSFFHHPLDDNICKKNNKIIYVAPCEVGGGHDENKMLEYTNFINNITTETFETHFQENTTRYLIKLLKEKSMYFNNTYNTILHQQDYLDENMFIVFSQFYQELNGFMYLDAFKWKDTQIRKQVFDQIKVLIYKNNMTLLLAEKELTKIEKYTKYAASISKLYNIGFKKDMDKFTDKFIKFNVSLCKYITIFSKKEQKEILNKINSIVKIQSVNPSSEKDNDK